MILGVLTTERPGRAYLPALVAEIDRQGWPGRKVVVSDGPMPVVSAAALGDGWQVSIVEKRHRDNGAAFRALLGEAYATGEDLLALEDDVTLAEGALALIHAFEVPRDLDLLSWFEPLFRAGVPSGLVRIRSAKFVYAQALTIPAHTVARLCDVPWPTDRGSDSVLAELLAGGMSAYHLPAVVQHVGRVSAAHPERNDCPRSETFVREARGLDRREPW